MRQLQSAYFKTCTSCARNLPQIDEYFYRNDLSGTFQSCCRDCHKARALRGYYQRRDKERLAKEVRLNRLRDKIEERGVSSND